MYLVELKLISRSSRTVTTYRIELEQFSLFAELKKKTKRLHISPFPSHPVRKSENAITRKCIATSRQSVQTIGTAFADCRLSAKNQQLRWIAADRKWPISICTTPFQQCQRCGLSEIVEYYWMENTDANAGAHTRYSHPRKMLMRSIHSIPTEANRRLQQTAGSATNT